jgi:hypothetical protein
MERMIARIDRMIAKFGAREADRTQLKAPVTAPAVTQAPALPWPQTNLLATTSPPAMSPPTRLLVRSGPCKLVRECSTESVQFLSFNPCTTFDHPSTKPSDTNFPSLPLPSGPSTRRAPTKDLASYGPSSNHTGIATTNRSGQLSLFLEVAT